MPGVRVGSRSLGELPDGNPEALLGWLTLRALRAQTVGKPIPMGDKALDTLGVPRSGSPWRRAALRGPADLGAAAVSEGCRMGPMRGFRRGLRPLSGIKSSRAHVPWHSVFSGVAVASLFLVSAAAMADEPADNSVGSGDLLGPVSVLPVDELDPIGSLDDGGDLDAGHYAAEFRISLDEARERLAAQHAFGVLVEEVAEALSATYSGALVHHEPRFGMTIYLVGDAELPRAQEILAALVPGGSVQMDTTRSLTASQITSMVEELDLAHVVPGEIQGLGYEIASDSVHVDATRPEGSLDSSASTSRFTVVVSPGPGLPEQEMPVVVTYAPSPAGDGIRGGLDMISSDLRLCTSGFNVNVNGTRGMTTAGHCRDYQHYRLFGGSWTSMSHRGEARTSTADIQWHTTSLQPGWAIHADSTSSTRTVKSLTLRTSQNGNWVRHRGQATGYSCGTVNSITYQPQSAGACPGTTCSATWVRTAGTALRCYPGDSGGVVFINNSAVGMYKGQSSSVSQVRARQQQGAPLWCTWPWTTSRPSTRQCS